MVRGLTPTRQKRGNLPPGFAGGRDADVIMVPTQRSAMDALLVGAIFILPEIDGYEND